MEKCTPLERMMAALRFERPDRVPVFPNNALASSRAIGVKVGQLLKDSELFAEALVTSFRTYGYDGVRISCDVTVEAEAMGGKVTYPEDAGGSMAVHPVKSRDDFDRLRPPDPHRDGRMPIMLDTTAKVRAMVGEDTYIASSIMGPMNIVAQLVGVTEALLLIYDDPEYLEKLLDFAVEVSFRYGCAMHAAGANCITLGEATCSVSMLGETHYEAFVQARHKRLVTEFKRAGVPYQTLHICGKLEPILEMVADTGVASIDVDSPVDVALARRVLGNRVTMIGNISPAELVSAEPERITALCREVLEIRESLGLVLGAGCNMSPKTPPENIHAMVAAAETYGRYE